jgi:anhydro-N-acetylmuramic acid kinase
MEKKYKVIGIMSGTSLDGLDIAYCEFRKNKKWEYKILFAETRKYSREWKDRLSNAFRNDKVYLNYLDKEYGKFIGKEIRKFINKHTIFVDFIASHGHTVFHQPHKKVTLQIGSGAGIASVCKLPVVFDFRSEDVNLGGQGAPLVPVVDKLLFSTYNYCLNLGGFANISFDNKLGKRIAFDICPVNIVLNGLAGKLGKEFDKGGEIASKGQVNQQLLGKLNKLRFYKMTHPKSLGREWVENIFFPIINTYNISVQDKLRTVVEHAAIQIALATNSEFKTLNSQLLITGGGAYNTFLLGRIAFYAKSRIFLPKDVTIQFKEAMAFAFLGVLKMRKEINILKSVTGAKRDSSGGRICFLNQKAESSP